MAESHLGEVMDGERNAGESVVMTVSAEGSAAHLAGETLARTLGIAEAEAAQLIARGDALIEAQRLTAPCRALLQVLGVRVAALSPGGARFDLSLRLPDRRQGKVLTALCSRDELAAMAGPAGLVMADLGAEEARARALILRESGLQVTLAARAGAVYDIFAPKGTVISAELERYLAILGCGRSEEALACGLEARAASLVLARFGALGLVCVHEDFQCFDLFIAGSGELSLNEAADFLASRGVADAHAALREGRAIRIEDGLNRKAARQFLADYRQIGLSVRLSLCGLAA